MKSIQPRFKYFQRLQLLYVKVVSIRYLIRPVLLRLRASSLISQPFAVRDFSNTGHANLTSLRTMLPTTVQIFYMIPPPYKFSERQPSTPDKAETASLLCSTAGKLLSRQQLVGTKRHGQKLLKGHDRVLAQLVVHQYRRVGLRNPVSSDSSNPTH